MILGKRDLPGKVEKYDDLYVRENKFQICLLIPNSVRNKKSFLFAYCVYVYDTYSKRVNNFLR